MIKLDKIFWFAVRFVYSGLFLFGFVYCLFEVSTYTFKGNMFYVALAMLFLEKFVNMQFVAWRYWKNG